MLSEPRNKKMLGVVLNKRYLDRLMSPKTWIDCIQSIRRTKEEMAKKAQKSEFRQKT